MHYLYEMVDSRRNTQKDHAAHWGLNWVFTFVKTFYFIFTGTAIPNWTKSLSFEVFWKLSDERSVLKLRPSAVTYIRRHGDTMEIDL